MISNFVLVISSAVWKLCKHLLKSPDSGSQPISLVNYTGKFHQKETLINIFLKSEGTTFLTIPHVGICKMIHFFDFQQNLPHKQRFAKAFRFWSWHCKIRHIWPKISYRQAMYIIPKDCTFFRLWLNFSEKTQKTSQKIIICCNMRYFNEILLKLEKCRFFVKTSFLEVFLQNLPWISPSHFLKQTVMSK